MSIRHKFLHGVGWSAAQSWGSQLVTLVVFAVLARLLSPAAFGLLAMANVFVALIKVFLDQGFASAIIQRRELQDDHLNTAFWTNAGVGLALTGIVVMSSSTVARLFGEPQLAPIVQWLSVVVLVSSLSAVQQGLMKRKFDFKLLAIRSLIAVLVSGVVGVTMAYQGYGAWSLVGQQISFALMQLVLIWRASDWRPKLRFSKRHFDDLFSFGANIVGINLAEFFNRNADKFLIGYYLGATALGYYAVAYKLLETLARLVTSVTNQVTFASFSALQEDKKRVRNAFYSTTQLTGLITFPMFLGLAAIAPQVVLLIFGGQWSESIAIIQILMLVGLLESIYLYNANVMLAMGKPSWRLKVNLVNSVANVIGFFIAVRWGIVAVAAAYVIRAYLLSPIPLLLVRRLIDIEIGKYLRNLAGPAVSAVIMCVAVLYFSAAIEGSVSLRWHVALSIAVGALVYLVSAAAFARGLLNTAISVVLPRSATRMEG